MNLAQKLEDFSQSEVDRQPYYVQYVNVILFWGFAFVLGFVLSIADGKSTIKPSEFKNSNSMPSLNSKYLELSHLAAVKYRKSERLKDFYAVTKDEFMFVEFSVSSVFGKGRAEIMNEAELELQELAEFIFLHTPDSHLEIESHTDDSKIVSKDYRFKNNWDLSAVRSAQLLEFFTKAGYPDSQIKISSRGAYSPKYPNRSPAGEAIRENRELNRRVKIYISSNPL